ncbi:uncharacterized protein [Typha latifolia]|uniref:uncharacterized protein n=1 Tax=Typha latifolia TaxID=4733 RepID=UPI003C2D56EC
MQEPDANPPSIPRAEQESIAAAPPEPQAPQSMAAAAPVEEETRVKKRKLEDLGFHNSIYFKIRTVVKDLRPLFVEVLQGPDFRSSNAAQDILKQIQTMIELSKKLRNDLTASEEPKEPTEKSLGGAIKEESAEKVQEEEKKGEQPQTTDAASLSDGAPENEPNSDELPSISEKFPEKGSQGSKCSEMKDTAKQLDEVSQGSSVIGGSPIGWNFLVYPGSNAVFYGVTKADALLRRSAK